MAKRIYGIDLGTTYSCVAGFDENGRAVVYRNDEGEATTPSVVWFEGRTATVGSVAKEQAAHEPGAVVSAIKREMGTEKEIVQSQKRLRPEMVSALILKKLVQDVQSATGEEVEDVVITCPAYFGEAEREATRCAGKLAGLNVLSIIDEPSAAAFSYGLERSSTNETLALVFDLGGGTFDVTIIRIGKEIKVVATDGDRRLGGRDWDRVVASYFIERYCEQTGKDRDSFGEDSKLFAQMMVLAEKYKRLLSNVQKVKVSFEYDGEFCSFDFTRDDFDAKTAGLLETALDKTRKVLRDTGMDGRDMTFLMVGGSTYMPQVANALKRVFKCEPRSYSPDEAVARGAALYARQMSITRAIEKAGGDPDDLFLSGNIKERVEELVLSGDIRDEGLLLMGAKGGLRRITSVCSKSYGIKYVRDKDDDIGYVVNLISKNTALPFSPNGQEGPGVGHSYTVSDNQTGCSFKVYENDELSRDEHIDIDLCSYLGEMKLTGLPEGRKAGQPLTEFMELDAEGLLHAWGIDDSTGKRCDVTIQIKGVLGRDKMASAQEIVDWFRVS